MHLLGPTMGRRHRTVSRPMVVLPHGISTTHHTLNGLSALAIRSGLLAYDFPGQGETPAPIDQYELDDLADWSRDFSRRFGQSGSITV
jgi:pimeloyl-ACP methyl ester carboxylesterase